MIDHIGVLVSNYGASKRQGGVSLPGHGRDSLIYSPLGALIATVAAGLAALAPLPPPAEA